MKHRLIHKRASRKTALVHIWKLATSDEEPEEDAWREKVLER